MAEADVRGNGSGQRRFQDDARETRAHAQAFATSLGNTMKDVDGAVRSVAERNPYAALGAALGVGLVLGGGIPPALIRGLVGVASRFAMAALLRMMMAEQTPKNEIQHEEGR